MTHQKDILTLDDFKQIWEIEHYYFSPDIIADPKVCYSWYLKNPHVSQALLTSDSKMIGFIATIPVPDSIYQKLISGTYQDKGLRAKDILAYEENKTYKLYFCSIAFRPEYKGKGYLKKIFKIWMDDLINLYKEKNIRIEKILGEAVTSDGEKLLKRMGMQFIRNSIHTSKIYEKEIPQDNYVMELKKIFQSNKK